MPSRDILDRLLNVEKKAEAIVGASSDEAALRLAAAREAGEASFKAAYEAKVREMEAMLGSAIKESDEAFSGELAAYQARLEAIPRTSPAFVGICEAFLAEGL